MVTGRFWTAPDLSVSVTEQEALGAIRLFEHLDWDTIEAGLKPGFTTDGLPIDRDNPHVRQAFMAEALTTARGAPEGQGLDLMDNKYWRFAVSALLEARDLARLIHDESGEP
jgi:hypothetical protein